MFYLRLFYTLKRWRKTIFLLYVLVSMNSIVRCVLFVLFFITEFTWSQKVNSVLLAAVAAAAAAALAHTTTKVITFQYAKYLSIKPDKSFLGARDFLFLFLRLLFPTFISFMTDCLCEEMSVFFTWVLYSIVWMYMCVCVFRLQFTFSLSRSTKSG